MEYYIVTSKYIPHIGVVRDCTVHCCVHSLIELHLRSEI